MNTKIKEAYQNYRWEGEFMGYRNCLLHFLALYFFTSTYKDQE